MKQERKTKARPMEELKQLRQRVAELEQAETERKQAEEVLRQTRDYLESLFNYANAPIICWDAKFKLTRFNHAFEHLADYKTEEVMGKDLSVLFPKESREQSLSMIKRTLSGEHWEVVEIPILRKSGDIRIVLWNSANVYAEDGKTLIATIAQGQDITERKQAEEALRKRTYDLGERVKELNCLYGISKLVEKPGISLEEILQGTVDLISPAWQYPEITCARIVLEGQVFETSNFKETIWKQDAEMMAHGDKLGFLEVCYLKEKPESDNGPFLKEERSMINDIAMRLGDITERKQAEEGIRKKSEEMEAFVYMVSHDLKNPVVSIQGFCSSILKNQRDELNEKTLFYIQRVQANASLMASLLEDLVELSGIGRIEDKKREISVQEVIKSVWVGVSRSLLSHDVEFVLPENLPRVFCSEKRLYQIFYNLLSNAVKFKSEKRALKVEIGYKDNKDNYTLFVRDNGIGIDQKYHDKIFEAFSQLKEIKSEGTGMGLTIVKKIVEANQGKVWVESQKGAGSTFCFTIAKKA